MYFLANDIQINIVLLNDLTIFCRISKELYICVESYNNYTTKTNLNNIYKQLNLITWMKI
jgi:hypothetical protein